MHPCVHPTAPTRTPARAAARLGNRGASSTATVHAAQRAAHDRARHHRARHRDRQRRVAARPVGRRALRAGAAVGHDRLGTPPGVPQHRDGALHDVHRRARHRRFHADEARARLLVGGVRAPHVSADRMARMGARERNGERGADPRPHPVGGRRSAGEARRLRHVRRLRGDPGRRAEGRAEPRAGDVDPDGRRLRLPAPHRSDDGVGRVVAGDRRRLRVRSARCRRAPTGFCSARSPPTRGSAACRTRS